VSKESRRAARAARESRRLGATGAARPAEDGEATEIPAVGSTGHTGASGGVGARRPAASANRAGRRERVRRSHEPTFLEKYRTLLIGIAGVAVAAIVVGFVFMSATQAAYVCTNTFDPSPTPTVSPGASTRLGFQQDDMGNSHVVSRPQRYLFCPPASGNHLIGVGQGPITPRVYKPDDTVGPTNWIHNLEHGGFVVLYRNDSPGATPAGLQAFRDFYDTFPVSPICKVPPGASGVSPVIARFDAMPHPYAALVWGRVLYMDTWDPALAIRFFNEESERLDKNGALVAPPEKQCKPQSSASPSAPAPSASPASSASPAASVPASVAPSGGASASPQPSPAAS
jgi:hypothetical protein